MTTAVIQIDQAALAEAAAMLTDVRNGTDRALVGGLLGGKVDISVLGWNGLLGTQISL